MLLIYTQQSTPRLQYICRFIFGEQLGVAYNITSNAEGYRQFEGFKFNYSHEAMPEDHFRMRPHGLLSEAGIREQSIDIIQFNGKPAFFETGHADYGFDLLSATFYLISRYEEYLPHKKDLYGRYAHENSIAWKQGFLQWPLVNYWIQHFFQELLSRGLKEKNLPTSHPTVCITYDIDIAWSYRNKGIIRNLGGFFVKPSVERLKVLMGMQKDPFDSYHYLDKIHEAYNLQPTYFFLVAGYSSRYDKNITPHNPAMKALIAKHAARYEIGIHPSWNSNGNFRRLSKEIKTLEKAGNKKINKSRQHYIYFQMPGTFESLIDSGIEEDFSMGYGSINGFRASVATPFFWYNLSKEESTSLRMVPFCFMDANSHYEQHLSPESAYEEMMKLYNACCEVRGMFCCIFHNNFLGEDPQFKGWKLLHERFISQLPQ